VAIFALFPRFLVENVFFGGIILFVHSTHKTLASLYPLFVSPLFSVTAQATFFSFPASLWWWIWLQTSFLFFRDSFPLPDFPCAPRTGSPSFVDYRPFPRDKRVFFFRISWRALSFMGAFALDPRVITCPLSFGLPEGLPEPILTPPLPLCVFFFFLPPLPGMPAYFEIGVPRNYEMPVQP